MDAIEIIKLYRKTLLKLFGDEYDWNAWEDVAGEFISNYSKMSHLTYNAIRAAVLRDIANHEELYP